MRRTGKSKTCVWRWQERFAEEGVDGLLRDKTRPSRIAPLEPDVAERVVALTLTDRMRRAMAVFRESDVAAISVHLAASGHLDDDLRHEAGSGWSDRGGLAHPRPCS